MISTPHTGKVKTVKVNIYKKYGKQSPNADFRDSIPLLLVNPKFSFPVFHFSRPTLKIISD
jgi:hypothetical protein